MIFISGLDETVDKVKGFAAGGVDYITKPYQDEEVLARVRSHLDLRRTKEALQRANEELEERVAERTAELARANEQLVGSEKALAERLKFETLLAEISARFINLAPDRIEGEIEGGQRQICEHLDLDRSALFQLREGEPGMMVVTCLYQSKGSPPVAEGANVTDLFPWGVQKLLSGETVTIGNMSDLPSEAARDRESYRLFGTPSNAVVPLSVGGGSTFGALSFAVIREERDFPDTNQPSNGDDQPISARIPYTLVR